MGRLRSSLKHAFGLSSDADGEIVFPAAVEKLAQKVVDRHLEAPAVAALELLAPLNVLGSALCQGALPLWGMFRTRDDLKALATALHDRRSLAAFSARIEMLAKCRDEAH